MSESAPERGGGGLDEAFSRKYGPLTGLQWTLVAALGGGAYIWYRNKHSTGTGSSTTSGQATAYGYTGQPYDYGPSIAALQSEVQGLQSGQAQGGPGTGSSTGTPATSTGTSSTQTSGGTTTVQSGPAIAQVYSGPKTSLAAATQYLQSQGYAITNVSLGGQNLSAAQIAQQQNTPVWSVTPYSNQTARVGLK